MNATMARVRRAEPLALDHSVSIRGHLRHPTWYALAAWVAFVQYCFVGWWLISVEHYAIGDAVARTLMAKTVVLGRDPHLAAIGFYWLPLPTIARVPFVLLLDPFGMAHFAGPMSGAAFAAGTVWLIGRIARAAEAPTWVAVAGVVIYAVNPVVLNSAANGMSEAAFGFTVALALYGYIRFAGDPSVWNLVRIGLGLGLVSASRFEGWPFAVTLAAVAGLQLPKDKRGPGFLIAITPTLAVLVGWLMVSKIIMRDALYFLHVIQVLGKPPADAAWLPADRGIWSMFTYVCSYVLGFGPAIVVLVLGLSTMVARNRRWAPPTGGLLLASASIPGLTFYQLATDASWGVPRFFALTPLFATVAVIWMSRPGVFRTDRTTQLTAIVGCGALVLGAGVSAYMMIDEVRTCVEGESVVFRMILDRGPAASEKCDSDKRTTTLPYEKFRDFMDPRLRDGKRIAMVGGLAPLMSRKSDHYILPQDRDWEVTMSDWQGRIDYIALYHSDNVDGYTSVLQGIVNSVEGGAWVELKDFDDVIVLYEWVPDLPEASGASLGG